MANQSISINSWQSELRDRVTAYERNHNICRFIYSTPFTVDGVRLDSRILNRNCIIKSSWQTFKTNLFPAAPRRTCRAIQEENHSHHCQPLPLHQNQNTGSKIICLDLMHYKISIFWLTAHCFSKVAHQKQIILTPIEVAIEDIQMKVNQKSKYEQQLLFWLLANIKMKWE